MSGKKFWIVMGALGLCILVCIGVALSGALRVRSNRAAKVYVSVMGDAAVQADCLKGLKSAAGFIRREVGRRVLLRSTPEFHFVPDNSVEHGAHIAQVLRQLDMERGQPGAAQDAGAQEE